MKFCLKRSLKSLKKSFSSPTFPNNQRQRERERETCRCANTKNRNRIGRFKFCVFCCCCCCFTVRMFQPFLFVFPADSIFTSDIFVHRSRRTWTSWWCRGRWPQTPRVRSTTRTSVRWPNLEHALSATA